MSELFCAGDYCDYYNSGAASFNENIGAWDTTEATSMAGMFRGASSFNQPLGDWSFDNIIDMRSMFYGASAFDQDLGWCVIPVAWTRVANTSVGATASRRRRPRPPRRPRQRPRRRRAPSAATARARRQFTTSAPRRSSSLRSDSNSRIMIAQSFTPPKKGPSESPRRVLAPVHDRSSFTPKKKAVHRAPIRDRSSSIPNCPY